MINPRRIYRLILAVAVGLLALIFSGPLETRLWGPGPLAEISRLAFAKVCHQDPGRSFFLLGTALPVCARCLGVYAGFMMGWLVWHYLPPARRDRPVANLALFLGMAPMVVDGTINTLGLLNSPPWLRCLSGLVFGATAARALWPAFLEAGLVLQRWRRDRKGDRLKGEVMPERIRPF